jgi:hypothetical protein
MISKKTLRRRTTKKNNKSKLKRISSQKGGKFQYKEFKFEDVLAEYYDAFVQEKITTSQINNSPS